LYNHAQRANRLGGIGHNQLWNQSELDRGHASHELHHQQLYRTQERNIDWHRKRHNIYGDRPHGFN
jgi:hypothetical protein